MELGCKCDSLTLRLIYDCPWTEEGEFVEAAGMGATDAAASAAADAANAARKAAEVEPGNQCTPRPL
jgi:hypothetical protein